MPITSLPSPTPRPTARRARGFGLLQVLLLIAVMAGLASMGYLQWRARAVIDSSRQERQALTQADKAIIAFATVEHRLPCPDTNRDGLEDCGAVADQKGWLPSATLRLAGVDPLLVMVVLPLAGIFDQLVAGALGFLRFGAELLTADRDGARLAGMGAAQSTESTCKAQRG